MKFLYLGLGWCFFALGIIGIALPILPTTPFMILAAFFFSRGSTHLHRWLLSLQGIGPLIRDWEEHGIIRMRAKVLASTLMLLLISYPLFFLDIPFWAKSSMLIVLGCVLAFIWSRPSQIKELS